MVVDAHCHFLTKVIAEKSEFYNDTWYDYNLRNQITWKNDSERIEILTYPLGAFFNSMQKSEALVEMQKFNDETAVLNSEKVIANAAIYPMLDQKDYVKEMYRAVEQLGLRGFSTASSYNGVYLDNKQFWPLFETATKLHKPIFVHPATQGVIGQNILTDYYLTPILGFVFDTTVCITKMLLSGVLDHFSQTQFVFSHTGGAFAYLLPRIKSIGRILSKGKLCIDPKKSLTNVYFDTCADDMNMLAYAVSTLGADHLLFGTDFPATPIKDFGYTSILNLNIPIEHKEKILLRNALSII